LFMKNWHDDTVTISDECPWLEDSNDAMLVADKLGIPFQTVDLSNQYKERIVDYMFDEYARGRTPNPDVLCNREIKFDVFMDIALELGADFVATGHYCQKTTSIENGDEIHHLIGGTDGNKDQSYFLCQVSQKQLAKTLFPIGHLLKPKVREIAAAQDLITAGKKDSQGLCFIGKVRLPDFLQQQLQPKIGDIVEIAAQTSREKMLEIVPVYLAGRGNELVTLSRKRKYQPAEDVDTNTIYVGQGKKHPGLYRRGLFVTAAEAHWIREDLEIEIGSTLVVMARIRYRQALEKATLHRVEEGLYVIFDEEQSAISPGQFVAWYRDNECLGSGVIA
jgi:tRNA-specific 2-thiouridylase